MPSDFALLEQIKSTRTGTVRAYIVRSILRVVMRNVCPSLSLLRTSHVRSGMLHFVLIFAALFGMSSPVARAQASTNVIGWAKNAEVVMESEGLATLTVVRKEGTRGRIQVDVDLVADAGAASVSSWTKKTLEFVDFQLAARFTFTVKENTTTNEPPAVAKFRLSNPRVATGEDAAYTPGLAAQADCNVTIHNNDDGTKFSFSRVNYTITESDALDPNLVAVVLPVAPGAAGMMNVSVTYVIEEIPRPELAAGAMVALPFPSINGTLEFATNETVKFIDLTQAQAQIANDVMEFDKEFKIRLDRASGEPDPAASNTVTYAVGAQAWARVRVPWELSDGSPAGAVDAGFNRENQPPNNLLNPGANGPVNVMTVDPANERIYVAGSFTTVNAEPRSGIARLMPNGANDSTFRPAGANGPVNAVAIYNTVTNAGKVVIGGAFSSVNGQRANSIARLNPNGSFDSSFQIGQGADGAIYAVALEPDGNMIVGGDFLNFNGIARGGLARLTSSGGLDIGAFQQIEFDGPVFAILVQGVNEVFSITNALADSVEERIQTVPINSQGGLLTLNYTTYAEPDRFQVIFAGTTIFDQTLDSGSILSTNETTGEVTTNFLTKTLTLDLGPVPAPPHNVVIVVNPGGAATNTTWGYSGQIVPAGTQAITVAGDFRTVNGVSTPGVARFGGDGKLDPEFSKKIGGGADSAVYAITAQTDGKIILGGSFRTFNNVVRGGITRLNQDGTQDLTFASGTGANGSVLGLVVDRGADTNRLNKIYVAGDFEEFNGTRRRFLARLFPEGYLDTGFMDSAYNQYAGFPNSTGIAGLSPEGYLASVALSESGAPIVGGSFSVVGGGGARESTKPRQNFAKLLGGTTPGPGNISFTEAETGVDEGGQIKPINFDRANGNLGEASVAVRTADSAATAPQDYAALNSVLPYQASGPDARNGAAGSASLNVNIVDDKVIEGDEDFIVNILGVRGLLDLGGEIVRPGVGLGSNVVSRVAIFENDREPTVFRFALSEFDVDEDDRTARIEVFRTGNSASRNTIDYIVTRYSGPGNATNAATPVLDFVTSTNTLSFAPGQTNLFFPVTIVDDEEKEIDEIIQLRLNRPSTGTTIDTNGFGVANLNLIDNDRPEGRLDFVSSTYTVVEGQAYVELAVRRTGGNVNRITIDYQTSNGNDANPALNAIAGEDYQAQSGTLVWNNQETAIKTIRIPIINNDLVETNESFTVTLLNPSVPEIVGNLHNPTTVTIRDDDSYGELSFSNPDYFADENGVNAIVQVVRRNGRAGQVTVDYAATEGTATNNVDFTTVSGTLTFASGETAKTFVVPILDDTREDGNRTVNLTLSAPTLATLGAPSAAKLTLVDDESFAIPAGDVEKDFAVGAGANGIVTGISLLNDGPTNALRRITIAGEFVEYNRIPRERVARLLDDGSLDTAYANNTEIDGPIRTILGTPDGKLVIGGEFANVDGVPASRIARLNTVGHLDTLFNIGSGADAAVNALGRAFVGTGTNRIARIVVGGAFTVINSVPMSRIALLGDDGRIDPNFDPGVGPDAPVTAVGVQRDNRIVIGGTFTHVQGAARTGIARLNLNGSLDSTFSASASVEGSIYSIAIQADDKILVGGAFTNVSGFVRRNIARFNVDGTLDTSFDPGTGANGIVRSVAVQPDGKILVGGAFTEFNGIGRSRITRLLENGQNDLNINFGSGANDTIYAVAPQYDRKIVIGGAFDEVNGFERNHLARLFGGTVSGNGRVEFFLSEYNVEEDDGYAEVVVQRFGGAESSAAVDYFTTAETAIPNGDYTDVSGRINFAPGESVFRLRIPILDDNLAEGLKTFTVTLTNITGSVMGRQPVARVRIQSDDAVFSFTAPGYSVFENVQDGRFVLPVTRQGDLSFQTTVTVAVTDGTATTGQDYTGGITPLVFTPGETVKNVIIPISDDGQDEGEETVNLRITTTGGRAWPGLANAVLTILDDDFHPGRFTFLENEITTVAETNGVVTINVRRASGAEGPASVRVTTANGTASGADFVGFDGVLNFAAGQTNATFNVTIIDDEAVEAPETFAVALSDPTNGAQIGAIPQLDITITDDDMGAGALDPDFNPGAGADAPIRAMVLQSDGRIVIGGEFASYNGFAASRIARVQPNGSFDTNFNAGGGASAMVASLAPADGGRVTVGGSFRAFDGADRLYLARALTTGALDFTQSASAGFNDTILSLGTQPDGKVIVGGKFTTPANHFARVNTSGSLDVSFNVGTGADGDVYDAQYAADGKVVLGGDFQMIGGVPSPRLARVLGNGLIDTNFNVGAGANARVRKVVPLSDGKTLVAGEFTVINGRPAVRLVRLNTDGSLDPTFSGGSPDGTVHAMTVMGDGRILIAGDFMNVGGKPRVRLARLKADGSFDESFDPALEINDSVYDVEVQTDGKIVIAGAFTQVNGLSRAGIARLNGREEVHDIAITAVTIKNSDLRITFSSQSGFVYELEGTTDFSSWAVVRNIVAAGTTAQTSVPIPTDGGYQFFRVRRVSP